MKTLVSILIAGTLSTAGLFAGAAPASPNAGGHDNAIATSKLPFRPVQKRSAGARQAAVATPKVNVGSPQLPFRPYQKQPKPASSNKPSGVEAANAH